MKKFLFLMVAIATLGAHAAPLYFTFSGNISAVKADTGGYAAAHGIKQGSYVAYIFVVDTARAAYTSYAGSKFPLHDSSDASTGFDSHYFFDSLASSTLFPTTGADLTTGSFFGHHIAKKSGGVSTNTLTFQTTLGTLNPGVQVILYIPDSSAVDYLPKVGDAVTGTENYFDATSAYSSVSMNLTLVSVGATMPKNGILARKGGLQGWMRSDMIGNSLVVENFSGLTGTAKIIDPSGRTGIAVPLGETAVLPLSGLSHGLFMLRAEVAGAGAPVCRTFFR